MTLKDLFKKADNGMFTYEQLVAAANEANAKFVDLSEGAYVAKQKYTDDLAARDTRISDLDSTIKARETDLASLQEQLKVAGTDAERLAKLSTDFTDLQSKYTTEKQAYEQKLSDQAYKFAVTDFANTQKFSSQAAKRDFINSMLSKKLQMEGDTILGATDFVAAYTKDNADAFVPAEKPESTPPTPKPEFAGPTASEGSASATSPFSFNFVGVRPHEKT